MDQKILLFYKKGLDALDSVISVISQILMVALVGVGGFDIFTRTVFRWSFPWSGEMSTLIAMWLYFLGYFVVVNRGEDIIIEYFSRFLPRVFNRILDVLIPIAIIVFCVVVLIKGIALQRMQSRILVYVIPIGRNYFSLPVLIGMGFVLLFEIYQLGVKISEWINPPQKTERGLT